jgi:hypothetical protein
MADAFRDGALITGKRLCRICKCDGAQDGCFEIIGAGASAQLRRTCHWVGPDLCSFCAEDGGPKHLSELPQGPEHFSGLLDMYGQPIRWHKDLPN